MPAFRERISQQLVARQTAGLARRLTVVAASNQVEMSPVGMSSAAQTWVNFASNNYLGLASDASVIEAWQQGLDRYGAGSGASPLVTGFSYPHQQLEATLCEWLGYSRAVLFNSGFSANQALLFSLLEKGDHLLQDRLNHASLMEAGVLCAATMQRFLHNNVQDLANKLAAVDGQTLMVTEGVFSMDGDLAPLVEIAALRSANTLLAVDDAHGIGVLGTQGAGSCQHAGIKPDLLVVTFGKALGIAGAAILCDRQLGDFLTQMARHHVYSTAMPPAQAHALVHAIAMVRRDEWRREKLHELSDYYDQCMRQVAGYVATPTAIKPIILNASEAALRCADFVKQRGIWLSAIRPPTVPNQQARLRVTLSALHEKSHIKRLADVLGQWMEAPHEH